MATLFEVNNGKVRVVCTTPRPSVYLLTFSNPPDNRLITPFCNALHLALDIIEHRHPAGVIITTSAIPKFYSNGMDLDHAAWTRAYIPDTLYALWKRVLTYPMPTVALMNGHAFAGGMMLAMMHDYRVMNPHKGYLCLNELELGAPLRAAMTSIFRTKLGNGNVLRKLILEAHRYKALDALKDGIIDSVGDLDVALAFVEESQLVKKVQPGLSGRSVYGQLKREMWKEPVEDMERENAGAENLMEFKIRERVKAENAANLRKVEEWERGGKAKL